MLESKTSDRLFGGQGAQTPRVWVIQPVSCISELEEVMGKVSPWMKKGNIVDYVRHHPHVNPLELVCRIFGGCTSNRTL